MADPAEIISFWRAAGPPKWWSKDDAFDAALRTRFETAHMAAARRELDAWMDSAEGALALILLTDQVPRNIYRGTGHAFATDPLARALADEAIARGHDRATEPLLRAFLYLPFEHSEAEADQARSVRLFEALGAEMGDTDGETYVKFAREHRDIIARFARFPHRNPALGRVTTDEEQAFLDEGGFAG